MIEKITQETANKLITKPGNVRGAVILVTLKYLRQKEGEVAVGRLRKRLEELNCPLSIEEIKEMDWYPEGLSVLIILLCQEIFGWTKKDVFELGNIAPKISFLFKILIKYFTTPKRCFEESPRYWRKHFDFGELVPVSFDEAEKKAVIRVEGYDFHPIACEYHRGYFLQFSRLILGKENIKIEETKCQFRGDPYHEYVISW